MMKDMSFLNVYSAKKNLIEFKCPSCGNLCDSKDKKCSACGYNLKDFKSIIFSKYKYFNNTIDLIKDKNYFNAILEISRFLAFSPDDEKANELYLYLLYKNDKEDEYNKQLELFEEKFKFSSFVMTVEEKGIENYTIPDKVNIDIEFLLNSFDTIIEEYEKNRYKTTNESIDLANEFFKIMLLDDDKKANKAIHNFYDKRLLPFLSKQEISLEYSDGKNYEEMDDNEKKKIDIIDSTAAKKSVNTIITISPAIYVRSKLISKEKAIVVNKSKRW